MRRVHIPYGIKERMNDILGSDDNINKENDVPGITEWSIQAAMLYNLKNIVKALNGSSQIGKIARGLQLTTSDNMFSISPGYGFTKNGDLINLSPNGISNINPDSTTGNVYIFIKHVEVVLDGDVYDSGKKVNLIGKSGSRQIVYDDASFANNNDPIALYAIVVRQGLERTATEDEVCLGYLTFSNNEIVSVESAGNGLFDNNADNLYVTNDIEIGGDLKMEDNLNSKIYIGQDPGANVTIIYKNGNDEDKTLIFKNGILTAST